MPRTKDTISVMRPLNGICPACKATTKDSDWRLTRVGEVICVACRDAEFDTQIPKLKSRRKQKPHTPALRDDEPSPQEWREDEYGRVFFLDSIANNAKFVYGIRKPPRCSMRTVFACEAVFELQRDAMYRVVTEHLQQIETAARGSETDYDVCLSAAMRAASVFNATNQDYFPPKPFWPYCTVAIKHAMANKNNQDTESQNYFDSQYLDCFYKPQPFEIDFIENEAEKLMFLADCKKKIDPVDWGIFVNHVLEGISQAALARKHGYSNQRISQIIAITARRCRILAKNYSLQL